ncbi:PilN domain-containing protein [Stenotrophomonas sp. NPDC077464]|uniref:PilN domain-containing protein n=1 Tax=unclassified Stenotrophomonas TaxID=196198 RepID=UPI0037CF5319
MARINLLPWRAERRKQRQREFMTMLGFAAIAGVVLSALIWFYYDRQISGQADRNTFLQAEIDRVREQNKEIDRLDRQKDRLLARKKVIEQLQAKRSQMVHLFDALVRTIPDGLVLTALKQEGDILTLEGRTQSNARVSAYMRNLENSGWMTKPELSVIEARKPEEEKDKVVGPVSDISALPYVFVVKVTLPAQSEAVDGLAPDGSAVTPDADPAAAPATAPGVAPLAPAPGAAPAAPAPAQPAPAGSRIVPAPATQPAASSTPQKGAA